VYVLSDAPHLANPYVGRNAAEARLFVAAADRLAAASGGKGTVFLEPIGHIGYRTGLTVIDEVLAAYDLVREPPRSPDELVVLARRPGAAAP
jgi:hypothetical protein